MKYLLTFIFCLFLAFGSYAEETNPEALVEYKSLKDNPQAVHDLRELKNCTITYYNIGVYGLLGGTILELVQGDPETGAKFKMIYAKATEQNARLEKVFQRLVDDLIADGYHPLEISIVINGATEEMLGVITKMIQDSMEKPERASNMLMIMMQGTNKCDEEFLK
jgi:hypothetical protein